MAKKYIELDKPIKRMTAHQLNSSLQGLKKSQLLRSIILNEKDFIQTQENRSLRSFWYSTVKPVLDKLGLLTEDDTTEEGLAKWDSELSRYTAELVKMGVLNYSDLKIVDQSRRRMNPAVQYATTHINTYGYQTTIAPYPNIIITTEKDTVYNILADIAHFFGCSCISGKGQNSLAAMEDLIRGIDNDKDIYILSMTDYDPSGYYIAETFKDQAEYFVNNFNKNCAVISERIGINPTQLTAEEIERNKYTPKKSNRNKWFRATGGINGEPKGLELDAFSPTQIRNIFITSLKKYITDQTPYQDFIKEAYIKRTVLESISEKIDNIYQDIAQAEADKIDQADFDVFELALLGYDRLPINEICSGRVKQIREAARERIN